jgi:hypothetical protein
MNASTPYQGASPVPNNISRRQALTALSAFAASTCLPATVEAAADGAAPFIKVAVNYIKRGTTRTLPAVNARVRLYRGNTLIGTKRADDVGHAMWERLPSGNDYRVLVEFNGQQQWVTGGGGLISIGPGSRRRPALFFWT